MPLTQFRRNYGVLSLLVLVLLWLSPTVLAQEPEDGVPIQIFGTLQEVGDRTITVRDVVINLGDTDSELPEVGSTVQIEGVLTQDGIVVATTLISLSPFEVTGMVDSANGTTVVVSGQEFDLSGANLEVPIGVGDVIEFEGMLSTSGEWVVDEVEVIDGSEITASTFEINGALNAIGLDFVVVGGQMFSIEGSEISDSLLLGAWVKIEGRLVDGQLIADEVSSHEDVEDDPDQPDAPNEDDDGEMSGSRRGESSGSRRGESSGSRRGESSGSRRGE